jgi:hypothetical protein
MINVISFWVFVNHKQIEKITKKLHGSKITESFFVEITISFNSEVNTKGLHM